MSEQKNRQHILSVGAGRMGRGIGHIFAFGGHPVTLLDLKSRSKDEFKKLAQEAMAEIRNNLSFLSSLDVLNAVQVDKIMALINIEPRSSAEAVLAMSDIVIEGVPETLAAKKSALELIGNYAGADVPVLSTTSSMLVTELQNFIVQPNRFINTHFLNPAYLIPLVEVSPGPDTDEDLVTRVFKLLESIGKVPVRCAASPGYIIPRLQSLIMSEACRMVHEGVASAEEIDRAITHGLGPRYTTMGVLEFIDWGGLDVHYYASHQLAKSLNSPRHAPPPEVDAMMERGERGMHAGRGYYNFEDIDVDSYQKDKLTRFVKLFKQLGHIPKAGV